MRANRWLLVLGLLMSFLLAGCDPRSATEDSLDLKSALGGDNQAEFERATQIRPFQFPADHAAHPAFRNEWWYATGNLQTAEGRHFGYQVTFFRIGLAPTMPNSPSWWASQNVWMAHVAITDVEGKKHVHDQRFARGAAGLAGQAMQPFRVWLEDWQLLGQANGEFPWQLQVKAAEFALDLTLTPEKQPVLQGNQGLSQKSSEVGNASYYYSLTRLATTGTLRYADKDYALTGSSWLDREWSTSVLGEHQAGWDWFSLQLFDQQEVMFYRMRLQSGEADQVHSKGRWVKADGSSHALSYQEVQLKPLRTWQSARGSAYPVVWDWKQPAQNQHWRIEALVDDQLMETGITYWEGAVRVLDANTNQLLGYGYLEMSGY